MTLVVLMEDGYTPVEKDRFINLAIGTDSVSLDGISTWEGMLNGPLAFLLLMRERQSKTSSWSVGVRKRELGTGFFKYEEKCLELAGMVFLRSSAIELKYSLKEL